MNEIYYYVHFYMRLHNMEISNFFVCNSWKRIAKYFHILSPSATLVLYLFAFQFQADLPWAFWRTTSAQTLPCTEPNSWKSVSVCCVTVFFSIILSVKLSYCSVPAATTFWSLIVSFPSRKLHCNHHANAAGMKVLVNTMQITFT